MDYADLVTAIQERDEATIDSILSELTPRLIKFLRIHMGATQEDAKDCVQQSLMLAIEVIRQDKLKDPDKILTYLMTSCRNNYLKEKDKYREVNYEKIPDDQFVNPSQITGLLEKERRQILEACINELKKKYRTFIEYWFDHPDSDAEVVADHFNLSTSNVWTRKHRVIKQLHACIKKKINQ